MKPFVIAAVTVGIVFFAGSARAGIDCAQCTTACKPGKNPTKYPEELGPEQQTAAVKHSTPEAETAFSDAKKKDPAFGGRDLPGAVRGYKRAVLIDGENSSYRNHLAAALITDGNLQEAIYNLDQATKLVPSEAKYLVNLGYAYHRLGDETRALLYYMRGLMLDPHDVRARLFSGYALEILGYSHEAVLELRKVLSQDPLNDGARRALARLGTLPDPIGAPPPPPPPLGPPPPPPPVPLSHTR